MKSLYILSIILFSYIAVCSSFLPIILPNAQSHTKLTLKMCSPNTANATDIIRCICNIISPKPAAHATHASPSDTVDATNITTFTKSS